MTESLRDEAMPAGLPEAFGPEVRAWFDRSFDAPTPVQLRAWEAVTAGEDVLVVAPTGSGKTLAAFLHAIDSLSRQKAHAAAMGQRWKPGVRVLYVSPMKALGADVERNLQRPLEQIAEMAAGRVGRASEGQGAQARVTTALRTGDTTPEQRRRIVRNPPDILITTPESLYLMLTSQAREVLRAVEVAIVDEVHAIAGSKRGAHLALSLERLDDLLERPAQRIGLSATVHPLAEVARFLGGARTVRTVVEETPPAFDLSVRFEGAGSHGLATGDAMPSGVPAVLSPESRLGSVSIWPRIEAAVLDLVLSHDSTIVFVNSRGLCEKLTARLNELYAQRMGAQPQEVREEPVAHRSEIGGTTSLAGPASSTIARAHHGSVSKDKRLEVEAALKGGALRCVVATSSLELGIDMGSVDLVVQVAPPSSVASGLQRIGRANHQVGGRSQAVLFPRTRIEVLDAAVVCEGMREGAIERTRLVSNALDVLAQQTIAAVAMDALDADAWFATVRRSANYAQLTRSAFDAMLAMVSGGFDEGGLADVTPRIVWDRETGRLTPRSNSQRLAVTGAGTIPDRGTFPVMLPEADGHQGRRRVGELDEEMVMESRVGDVIALGTSTWRIREISGDRVVVDPAPGRSARLPFWHGDVVARPADAGRAKGAFVRQVMEGVGVSGGPSSGTSAMVPFEATASASPDVVARLAHDGLDQAAQDELLLLLKQQRQATGAVPDDRTLVVERCQDEMGDWIVILHSPYGRRVHEPWALAVAERIKAQRGFDPQVLAADDGIVVRLPMTEETLPGPELFCFDPDELVARVKAGVDGTALFATRFRECAARALLMKPTAPGKRAPLWLQRVKGGQLLEAARQDPAFPLLAEAARECLQDVYDLDALTELARRIQCGEVRVLQADTEVPSPFAAPLLLGYAAEHLYEGDLPHAERTAALLSVDPVLLSELLGGQDVGSLLDPDAVRQVVERLQRLASGMQARNAEDAFDLLRSLGPLTVHEVACRMEAPDKPHASDEWAANALEGLQREHRAFSCSVGGRSCWAAVGDAHALALVLGVAVPDWALVQAGPHVPAASKGTANEASRLLDRLTARLARTNGPFSAGELARRLGVARAYVEESLQRLAATGAVTSIRYPAQGQPPSLDKASDESRGQLQDEVTGAVDAALSWVDVDVLRRLRARSLQLARQAVAPVSRAAFVEQVLRRQMVQEDAPFAGIDGVAQALVLFEGVHLPFSQWESEVLPLRVPDYRPGMLDELVASGEVVWAVEPVGEGGAGSCPEMRVAFYPTDSPLAPISAACLEDAAQPGVPYGGMGMNEPQAAPTVEDAVVRVLAAAGRARFATLVSGVQESGLCSEADEHAVARALEALVRRGQATCDSLAFLRAGGLDARQGGARTQAARSLDATRAAQGALPMRPRRVSSRRGRGGYGQFKRQAEAQARERVQERFAFFAALEGGWSLLMPSPENPTLHALALTESLLDRFGVVAPDVAKASGLPGGLSCIRPVLRGMEEAGDVLRGAFVEGLGPMQFATHETVEELRRLGRRSQSTLQPGESQASQPLPATGESSALGTPASPATDVPAMDGLEDVWAVVPVDDPACLWGTALAWPPSASPSAPKPVRKAGATVVVCNGEPVLYAAPRLKQLVSFESFEASGARIEVAVRKLAAFQHGKASREGSAAARRKTVVESFNGVHVLDTPMATLLQECGFVRMPEGMRLYANPF